MLRLAQAQYLGSGSAGDCMLLYLAMRRKEVLLGLLRRDPAMARAVTFFSNDFASATSAAARFREQAVTNAYNSLAKRSHKTAAAFFLLGGAVEQCVRVCFSNERDWQLALVVARLYQGPASSTYKNVLEQHMLPAARYGTRTAR